MLNPPTRPLTFEELFHPPSQAVLSAQAGAMLPARSEYTGPVPSSPKKPSAAFVVALVLACGVVVVAILSYEAGRRDQQER